MRLIRNDNVLVDKDGNHFTGLMPTCFLLCSPNYDLSYAIDYIDYFAERGAQGFRALWNCFWGPTHNGEHGGNTVFWGNDPLRFQTEKVLQYLATKGMYLILEILDPSIHLFIGDRYYAQDSEWEALFDYVAYLNHSFPNLIVGTGNEPAKVPYSYSLVRDWQIWAVDKLKDLAASYGDEMLLAVEISNGTGIPELAFNSDVDILGYKTPRWDNISVLRGTYEQLEALSQQYPDKVIWGQEPPRRNYPNEGDWCSDTHKEWLRKIMFMHIGKLYTPHGLGHGEEEHKPIEWGGDGKFFWGVGSKDWPDIWKGRNAFVNTLRFLPSAKEPLRFDFYPDNSWYFGDGFGFSTQDNTLYICLSNSSDFSSLLPQMAPCRYRLVDPVTGGFRVEFLPDGNFVIHDAKDKLVFIKPVVADEVKVK